MTAGAGDREFRVEALSRQHDRASFSCGAGSLDLYLKTQASQDMRRKANAVFVMVRADAPRQIVGYFTLCAFAVSQGAVPEAAHKHIPRYPLVSATLIGRLAVDSRYQSRGIGGALLANALRKASENASTVGSSMVVVDALDERAARFYEAYGFIRLADAMRLILPMQTIAGLAQGGPRGT
ncbi:MAG TPA: GNAT family N-acetyltransferase [Rhizomicrobium sp.]|nr:GNAT family N-acetyltransferase [Rhizomicrobium sp.]